uniref:E3 ubiquitin-protein ligase XIAP-like n=1 Tax=Styela clava TaxID=7725 RepID=UPI00193999CA|nr:E3 ubiquitin-protein ligase XIAP-like [Styela clava]
MATRSQHAAARRLEFAAPNEPESPPADVSSKTQKKRNSRRSRRSFSPDIYGAGSDYDENTPSPARSADEVLLLNTRSATVRLSTFPKFPNSIESSRLWASNGFYINEKGNAECFSCHVIIIDWKILSDPNKVHMERYPKCRFRRGEDTGNVPFNCRPATPLLSSSDDDNIPSPPKLRNLMDTPPETPRQRASAPPLRYGRTTSQLSPVNQADTQGCSHWDVTPIKEYETASISTKSGINLSRYVYDEE